MIKKFALILVALLIVGCVKSFEVSTLSDVRTYKILYQLKDNDIIDTVTYNLGFAKRLNEDPSYYFVKEIKDKIESEFGLLDRDFGINLDLKQLEYLSFKLDAITIGPTKNSYAVELILKAIIKLLNKKVSESDAIKILKTLTKKLEDKYDSLKYIIVNDTANLDGYYTIETKIDIDDLPYPKIAQDFEILIVEIADLSVWKMESNFLEIFQSVLGDEGLCVIKKIGIRLDRIESALRQKEQRLITKKTLETLLDIICKKTSVSYATETIDLIIKNLSFKHDVLKYVNINSSRYDEGIDAILVGVEVNLVETNEIGKALWAVIKKIKEISGDINFMEDFKKELGYEYLKKIEEIGVKLNLLEMLR